MAVDVRLPRSPVSRRPSTSAAAVAACLCLLLSGCLSQGLAFRVDDRLTITAPADRAEVTLPVTVRWDIRDFEVVEPGGSAAQAGKDAGYFAVFVDGTPQPPGKPLSHLARDDRSCRPSEGCPDAEYLAARNVYTTSARQITFEQLPRPSNEKTKERHAVTIVLLDPAGKRIGESAFEVTFTLDRKGSS
jgi:hypothetical protein